MKTNSQPCALCNRNSGNSYKVAQLFGWPVVFAAQNPDLMPYSFVVLVCANTGDEELQPEMEQFLCRLKTKHKRYAICELGNYFGFERDNFGCKKIVRDLLEALDWKELADISIDALPVLELEEATRWVRKVHEIVDQDSQK